MLDGTLKSPEFCNMYAIWKSLLWQLSGDKRYYATSILSDSRDINSRYYFLLKATMVRESKAVFMLLSPLDTKWRTRQRTNSLHPLRLISWSQVFKGNFCIYLETGNNGKLSDFLGNSENLDILVVRVMLWAPFKTTLHFAFVVFYLDFGSHYANAAYFLTSLPCQRFFSLKLISL